MADVEESLVSKIMPWLAPLKEAVTALDTKAKASHRSVVAALEVLAVVVVQDALVLAPKYPDHKVHQLLRESELFRLGYCMACVQCGVGHFCCLGALGGITWETVPEPAQVVSFSQQNG
jgi:hypothetical protein